MKNAFTLMCLSVYRTLLSLVSELPHVNRDTLAFIMLHLKRVSTWKHCSMGTDNLSKIFGPTLIRNSLASVHSDNQMMILEESKRHPLVMQRLFEIPEHFWSQFLTPSSRYALNFKCRPVLTTGINSAMIMRKSINAYSRNDCRIKHR